MKDIIIGSHAWFAREGSTVGASPVVSTALPVFASTEADWTQLGSIEQWEPQIEQTKVTRRAPVTGGGKYEDRKEFILDSKLVHAFAIQQFGELEFELLSNADGVTAGAYVPNSRSEAIEGWLHREAYEQDGDLIDTSDTWVSLTMDSFQFAENLNPHTLMARVLGNVLNEGTLSNLS
jgi:hypothetical protein